MKKKFTVLALTLLLAIVTFGCSSPAEYQRSTMRGVWEDDTYTNEFAGITYELPVGWVYSTEAEIAKQMSIDETLLEDDEAYEAELAKQQSIYDMIVQKAGTGSNIIVMFENLKMSNASNITIDDYITAFTSQLTNNTDIDYVIGENYDVTLGSDTFRVLEAGVTNLPFAQYYFMKKIDTYMCVIIVTVNSADDVNDIISYFK